MILSIGWSLAKVTTKITREGELTKNPSGRMSIGFPGKGRHNRVGVGRMGAAATSRECGEIQSGWFPLTMGILHIIIVKLILP